MYFSSMYVVLFSFICLQIHVLVQLQVHLCPVPDSFLYEPFVMVQLFCYYACLFAIVGNELTDYMTIDVTVIDYQLHFV